jgi:hypothetical protein
MLILWCVTSFGDWEFEMKQAILALMLAITLGVVFVAYSRVAANAGGCQKIDTPVEQIP